jgi:ubiquinone/menaquinone biosynthesis C-methylase UbiE
MKQKSLTNEQFGNTAYEYLISPVHAEGADLQRLTKLTKDTNIGTALDLGCGAGHASFAIAQAATQVTAYDLSPQMLAQVQTEAAKRGLQNINTQQGFVEQLPFADATFDLVVTRLSAHHWSDVPAALREIRRVLKSRGTLVIIDVVASENALFDTVLQAVEILRDASHIRDYRISEWCDLLHKAGFQTPISDKWTITIEFHNWIARMRTSQLRADAIRDMFENASDEVRQHFKVQADSSFDIEVAWLATQL